MRTTSLVHEAYLKLARPEALDVADRAHFFAVAAALALADEALAWVVERMGPDTDEHAQALLARAVALEGSGRTDEARALRRQRLDVLRRVYGDAHPAVAREAARLEQGSRD